MASIRTTRCPRKRSDAPSRDRWASKAPTRRRWPACAPSAPSRSSAARRPRPGANTPQIELTPILDGRLITETAETAYKAKRQPRVPLLAGSNSADTAGNRIKATTKDEFFARFGQWSAQAKAAYDPDGTTDLATMVSRANDDFGQAEPARFAANAFAANGSPAYLYRFSYVATRDAGTDASRRPARRRNRVRLRHARRRPGAGFDALARGSGGLADGAELLGQLRQDRRPERCRPSGLAAARPEEGPDLRIPAGRLRRAPAPIPANRGST